VPGSNRSGTCSADGKEVLYQHIAKGYEISPGKYVVITNEELE
jgi:DNA end-binding protein Ku